MTHTSHQFTHIAVLVSASLAFSGPSFAKKKKKQAEEEAPAATVEPNVPDDATSKKFAHQLVDAQITKFSPTDAVGATFLYDTLSFEPDNTWHAAGYVEVMDERMECTEHGTWTMEPATAPNEAIVAWVVDTTDCAGREAGQQVRARLTIDGDDLDVLFR